ncbi:MAG TPA: GNAT family N-acetyltransferase [Pseudonocardiaceae bacterium]
MTSIRAFDRATDGDIAWRLRAIAFGGPRQPEPGWTDADWQGWVGTDDDGTVRAFCRAYPMRQFWGGVAVPVAGLASVAVDPSARGRGFASAMLDRVLADVRDAGQPLSILYPSVPALYRGRGWEHAGVCESVEVPTLALRAVPRTDVPVRPATDADLPAIRACYLRLAAEVDGLLDRSAAPFDMAGHTGADMATVVDGADGEDGADGLRGYLVAWRGQRGLVVEDLVAHDTEAARALLTAAASWAGALHEVRLRLLEPRPLMAAALTSEISSELWMLRVVDLAAAVAARGWPRAALLREGLAVDLDVVDEHAPWNAGPHRLVVTGSGVEVAAGGAGTVRITARGLAAWYAGAADTATLRRAGLLSGPPADAAPLDLLTGAAGPARLGDGF